MQKVGIIGIGRMADIYMDVLRQQPGVECIGALGNSPEKCSEFQKRHQVPVTTGGDIAAWLNAQPELTGLILCTPEWIRIEPIQFCIQRGIPILVEKPLVASEADLGVIASLTSEDQRLITVAHSLRYSPRFGAAKRALQAGQIGEVRHVYFRRNPPVNAYRRVSGKFPLEFWLSPHDIDLYRWMTGDEIDEVHTFSRPTPYSEDSFLISHLTSRKGIHIVQEVSWCSPPLAGGSRPCEAVFRGTQGVLRIDDSYMNVELFRSGGIVQEPDTYEHFEINGAYGGIFRSLVEAWLSHLRGTTPNDLPTFADALRSIQICSGMSRSLKTKASVKV